MSESDIKPYGCVGPWQGVRDVLDTEAHEPFPSLPLHRDRFDSAFTRAMPLHFQVA